MADIPTGANTNDGTDRTGRNIRTRWIAGDVYETVATTEDVRAMLLKALNPAHPWHSRWSMRIRNATTRQLVDTLASMADPPKDPNLFLAGEVSSWLKSRESVGDPFGPDIETVEDTADKPST